MPRIPDTELARLKREVKLADLCRDYGITLHPTGPDNLMGCCPFHDDREPSLGVTPSKNLWNCLAGCGGGDNLQFVMRKEGVSFRHAVEILQRKFGTAPSAPVLTTRQGTAHPVLVDPATALADHALLKHVADFYHQTFCNDPKAMKYLEARRCFHPEAAKVFRLGYANRTLGYRVPATTAEGKKLKAQLQRLGILRASGHEHLTGSVVFPILDAQGNIAQMYGRKITPNLREGTPLHLYLPGEHRAVWNAAALRGQKEWLVCEALIDALTFWCAGFRNVTCAYGVNGFTPAHWALLAECPPERIIICFDNDDAGNAAAAKLAEQLAAKGVRVLRAKLPPGKDVNDVARENKNAQLALAAVIERGSAVASTAVASAPPATASEPVKHVAMVVDEITGEPLPIVDKESLETGVGWAPAPFVPAPYAEVQAQNDGRAPAPLAAEPPRVADAPTEAAKEKKPASEAAPPGAVGAGDACPDNGHADEASFTFGERAWRVRGVGKNLSFETLRVQLRAKVDGPTGPVFHLDTLDLCNAKHRQNFVAQARDETGLSADILKRDLGQVLLKVEELQEQHIRETVEPTKKEVVLNDDEREAALALLRDPQLLDRILADFERCGVVGEQTNKLVGYLSAVSRKLDEPLAVILQSTSAAGKSSLMDAILAFVPEEERIKYSAMTGQSLYYLGDADLQHKVLAIVEEEGAERASYALKLLQSEGELTIASTGKDPQSGRMVTQEYHVEGPVMIMLTTTAIDLDEELLNRCIVLTVDESREQTRAIHVLQRERETLAGMLLKLDRDATLRLHRNAQRLLRPLRVVNPFAQRLTFLDDRTRTRRDHMKYLTLIRTLALLHQHQRPVKNANGVQYLEATLEDIATANRLASEVLGRSLDELPPQTRRLLLLVDEFVRAECERRKIARADFRFSRRDVRERIRWSDTALKVHLHRLEEMEYLLVHRAKRGQGFVYEMLYGGEGQDGKPFVMGLLDAATLQYDEQRSGQNVAQSAPGQAVVSGQSAQSQGEPNTTAPNVERTSGKVEPSKRKTTRSRKEETAGVS
jgi:DNA primase catalytic core